MTELLAFYKMDISKIAIAKGKNITLGLVPCAQTLSSLDQMRSLQKGVLVSCCQICLLALQRASRFMCRLAGARHMSLPG